MYTLQGMFIECKSSYLLCIDCVLIKVVLFSLQHPMFGLVMSQISGKPGEVDIIKIDKNEGTEGPYDETSSLQQFGENSNSASVNCR